MNTVYLLHFDSPVPGRPGGREALVGHYLGFTTLLARRYDHHLAGRGSALVAAAAARGPVRVARLWSGDRTLERSLKRGRNHWQLCPICRPARKHRAAATTCRACSGKVCRVCARHLYARRDGVLCHVRRIGCTWQRVPVPH